LDAQKSRGRSSRLNTENTQRARRQTGLTARSVEEDNVLDKTQVDRRVGRNPSSGLDGADGDRPAEAAKQHDRQARAGWSEDPIVQGNYGEKIRHINRIVTGLKEGDNYPMSEVRSAMASQRTAPY
jgi:hypothetical protein